MKLGFHPCVGKIPQRSAWKLTLVLLLGESHGQRIMAGYSPQGWTESDGSDLATPKIESRLKALRVSEIHFKNYFI